MSQSNTPKELGYRFPAEWELQEAVWFAWPTRGDLWDGVLDRVKSQLASLYVLAARFQAVRVLCPVSAQAELRALLDCAGDPTNIELLDYECDDVWIRDFGPLFLLNEDASKLAMADWTYNAWGNKFPLQEKDNKASAWIAEHLSVRRFAFNTVLEGGAIESNGAGQILTTEAVLLNSNRNGPIRKQHIEPKLRSGLGIGEVLWLGDGLAGDDTDGHIDNLARFYAQDGILIAEAEAPEDPNFAVLQDNLDRLRSFQTTLGQPFASMQIPLPKPMQLDGEPLAASYMNYLVLNGAVLVPTYNQPEHDAQAIEIIGDCFTGREVIGFDCCDIIREGGAIHCMSQHQPAVS